MIEAERANYTIGRMCRLLGVDRRRYYEWRQRKAAGPSRAEQRRAALTDKIIELHKASDGTYGAPRIVHDLREAGETVSVKTVAKFMRQAGIAGISPRTWHPPTTIGGRIRTRHPTWSSARSTRASVTSRGSPISPIWRPARAGPTCV